MIIYIDMDDTIANCTDYWIEAVNRELGLGIVKENILEYSFVGVVPNVFMEAVFEIPRRRGFFLGLDPMPGAQEVIKELMEREWRYEVYFTTSPLPKSPYVHQEKCMWMQEYFNVGEERIIFTHRKDLLRGDIMIDDKIENLRDFKGHRIVFDQPWNRYYTGKPLNAYRCLNWEDVYNTVRHAVYDL